MRTKNSSRSYLLITLSIALILASIEPIHNFLKFEIDQYERKQHQEYCKSLFNNDNSSDNGKVGSDHPDLALRQNFLMTMDPKTKKVPYGKIFDAYRAAEASQMTEDIIFEWEERGPRQTGGRTRAIMLDPNDPDKKRLWAGSVGGGLWVIADFTSSDEEWYEVDDFWDNLAVTSLCYDPTHTFNFYAGTGEGWYNIDAIHGGGIWKSTNGGVTWEMLASTHMNRDFDYIQKVAVHPVTGDVYACTRSWSNNRGGVLRSKDGGLNWDRVLCTTSLPTNSITNRAADIEFTEDNSIVVSMGIGNTDGIYLSNTGDIGDWTPINEGIPPNRDRIELATAPSDAQIIYAAIEDTSGYLLGLFKTTNKGSNWTQIATPMATSTLSYASDLAWYALIIKVHPTYPEKVYSAAVHLARSDDGGSSWDLIPEPHTDFHNIIIREEDPGDVIFACDGGVYYTDRAWIDPPNSVTIYSRNKRYNVTQYYSCAIHPIAGEDYILGGTQDNGSLILTAPGTGYGTTASGGDGGFCFIDQNPKYQFTTYIRNKFHRSTDYGGSFFTIVADTTGRFINPADYDSKEKIIYSARDEFSLKLIRDATSSSYSEDVLSGQNFGATASHIKVSPYEDNTIYVGVNGGKLFKIEDANSALPITSELTDPLFPAGYISCVEIGESDDQLLVTFSNFGEISVWESLDNGSSWVSKEGDLPDMPVRWALYNPINYKQVLLATDVGVWTTEDITVLNPHWSAANSGLANVRVDMLKARKSDNLIVAATHGRGIYSTNSIEFLNDAKILAEDGQSKDNFGSSVSLSGIHAIIGARGADAPNENSGAAYVFIRSGRNSWTQLQKLIPEQPGDGDNFGCSVSIHGDYALIGARYDESQAADAGAAYIFKNESGTWIQKQKLLASDGGENYRFGFFVSLFGNYAVVGAPGADANEPKCGAAYIFKKEGENWIENKKIVAFDGHEDDAFGVVTIYGNHIAVGAPNHAFLGNPRSGAVYLYELIDGEWQPREILSHDTAEEGDNFGYSVSIYNEELIIGAFAENSGVVESGAAYIYKKDGAFWAESKKLTPPSPLEYQSFGRSVSIIDEFIAIGASGDWENGLGSGSVFVYQERDNDWFRQTKIVPEDGEANDFFGTSVQIYNDIILAGAYGDDDNGDISGSAYAFTNFSNPNDQPVLSVNNNLITVPKEGGDYYLRVNNIGTGTMDWISAVDEDWITITEGTFGTNFGFIHVIVEANDCCERSSDLRVIAPNAFSSPHTVSIVQEVGVITNEFKIFGDGRDDYGHFGWSVAIDGNTAVVGAEGDSSLGYNAGAVYVFEREGCDWIQKAKLTVTNQAAYYRLGISVDICGDQIIAGTWNKGKAYIFKKPASGWHDMTETAILTQAEPMGTFGYSVAISANSAIVGVGAPSVNRAYVYDKPEGGWMDMTETNLLKLNGRTDFFGYSVDITDEYAVIGETRGKNLQGVHTGAIHIFKKEWFWSYKQSIFPLDGEDSDNFGWSVSVDDEFILVGAPDNAVVQVNSGAAYVYQRDGDVWKNMTKLVEWDWGGIKKFGYSVGVCDRNIIIGAAYDGPVAPRSGSAYSFILGDGGWTGSEKFFPSDAGEEDYFGFSVAISDDAFIAGAYMDDDFGTASGSAYCFCNTSDLVVNIKEEEQGETFPVNFVLSQNYPNPFNPNTAIRFGLRETGRVKLTVYDILGREVIKLVDEELKAGYHLVEFNSGNIASGVYLYRLEVKNKYSDTKKMILLK